MIPIDVTASNLTVVIPDTVPVEVQADMTLGNLNEGAQNHGGMTSQQSNYNTDKPGARADPRDRRHREQHHHPGRKLT